MWLLCCWRRREEVSDVQLAAGLRTGGMTAWWNGDLGDVGVHLVLAVVRRPLWLNRRWPSRQRMRVAIGTSGVDAAGWVVALAKTHEVTLAALALVQSPPGTYGHGEKASW